MNVYDMARLLRTFGSTIGTYDATAAQSDRESNEYRSRAQEISDCVGPDEAARVIAEAYAAPRLTDAERDALLKQKADEAAEFERAYQADMRKVREAHVASRPEQSPVGWAPHKTKQVGQSIHNGLRMRYAETRAEPFDFPRAQVGCAVLSAMAEVGLPNMLHRTPEEKEKVYDAAIALLIRYRVVVTTH